MPVNKLSNFSASAHKLAGASYIYPIQKILYFYINQDCIKNLVIANILTVTSSLLRAKPRHINEVDT